MAAPWHPLHPSYTRFPTLATSFQDRKSTRLNSSHTVISYAVFCLKKKKMIRAVVGRINDAGVQQYLGELPAAKVQSDKATTWHRLRLNCARRITHVVWYDLRLVYP